MGFFKNLKEDFSKAVNELLPDEKFEDETVKELSEPGLKQEKDLSETIKEEPETELIEEVLLKDNLRDNKHKAEEKTMAKFRNKSTDTGREPLYDDNVDKEVQTFYKNLGKMRSKLSLFEDGKVECVKKYKGVFWIFKR